MFLADYHIHSNHSNDTDTKAHLICESAIRKEISEICFTDHYEVSPKTLLETDFHPKEYFEEMKDLQEKYKGKLSIKIGLEVGQPHENFFEVDKLYGDYAFDYIICSLHNMIGKPDLMFYDYPNIDKHLLLKDYFSELLDLAKWNKFNCMGHLDLPKRYAVWKGEKLPFDQMQDEIKEIFKVLIQNSKGLEVNTSGIRQGVGDFMPSLEILKIFLNCGGEIVSIGSDAHTAENVGSHLKEGLDFIKTAGFHYFSTFENGKPIFNKI